VRRRLRASSGNAPEGDDEDDLCGDLGEDIDDEIGQEQDLLPTPAAESR
jgi:hypothetical protein